jgi:hypothetical protein
MIARERCGDHLVVAPVAKVNAMKRQFPAPCGRYQKLTQLAQNRRSTVVKSMSWPKSRHYIFGEVAKERAFLQRIVFCRRESRGLMRVNSIGRHYIIKSAVRAA